MTHLFSRPTLLAAAFFAAIGASAQPVVDVDVQHLGATVSPTLYGIFFEEINHAGDGGLYAELVQNRSFEDDAERPLHWTVVGKATQALSSSGTLNGRQAHHLSLRVSEAGGGKFKLMPNAVYSLEELWECALRYQSIHKTDYIILLCLDNINQFIKVLVK